MGDTVCQKCTKPFRRPAVVEDQWEYQFCSWSCLRRWNEVLRSTLCKRYKLSPDNFDSLVNELEYGFYMAKQPSHVRRGG